MAPIVNTLLVLAVTSTATSAFAPASFVSRPATQLHESFGFKEIAEDTYENQPDFLKGEAEYKTWIGQVKDNSFVNRQVCFSKKIYFNTTKYAKVGFHNFSINFFVTLPTVQCHSSGSGN